MELIEKMVKAMSPHLHPDYRRENAQAALTALIEHVGGDGVTEALRAENARLREALGLIIENESADTGYGNSSAKIARAALGEKP